MLPVIPIRDWFITDYLLMAFTYSDFEDCEFVYNEFKKICRNEEYLAAIEKQYLLAKSLMPGNPAPDIELPDENGNMVRLSDFRGQVVYMDFWGTGCGPCIYEFQNHTPAMKEKYKDLVYIYVSVDDSESQWKRSIAQFGLEGVNLWAKGWSDNPACQSYGVQGIPHYVIIGKDGRIVKNQAPRPSEILTMGAAEILEQALNATY